MKSIRATFAATFLSLLLAVSVSAGQISSPGVVGTPPPPAESIATTVILTLLSVIPIP